MFAPVARDPVTLLQHPAPPLALSAAVVAVVAAFVAVSVHERRLVLATAKRLVDAHRSRIGYRARTPRGTVFWVDLPLAPELQRHAAARPATQPREGSLDVRSASRLLRVGLAVLTSLSIFLLIPAASAETLESPIGGKAVALPAGRVACAPSASGWTVEADKRSVRPPTAEATLGVVGSLAIAASEATCASSSEKVSLVTIGAWPTLDATQLSASLDDARLEVRGKRLRGAHVRWEAGAASGEEVCTEVRVDGDSERCTIALGRGLGADPSSIRVTALPAGAAARDDASIFDESGKRTTFDRVRAVAARVIVNTLVRPDVAIDALSAAPSIPLQHADAVTSVDCWPASCVLDGSRVLVGSLPTGITALNVRLKLAKGVVARVGEAQETAPSVKVPVLRCPLSVESGAPLRAVDGQRAVLRLEGRCAAEAKNLRFAVGGATTETVDIAVVDGVAHVVVRLPRTESEELSFVATRTEGEAFVVAQTRVATRAAPAVRVALELSGRGAIDFVPTNAGAIAHASAPTWDGSLAVLPVDAAYVVETKDGITRVRGVAGAFGAVSLRVSLRRPTLPAPFAALDLAVLVDPVQRPIREASVPLPILGPSGATAAGKGAIVELVCDTGDGAVTVVAGATSHVPFDRHDSCRLVFHRERIDPAAGTQRLALDVDVNRVDGSPRSEARVSRTITLAPGDAPRTVFLHGAESRFDRYSVRLTQVTDDKRTDTGDVAVDSGLPAAQWSVITGRGSARVYATTAIPTGLYRVSDRDHSGLLTLNFGVLARLTWLDTLGREGLLALEAGVVGVGLANDQSPNGHSMTQVSIVTGIGLSVPIANRALATETAVNLHAWVEYEPGRAAFGSGSPWAFVFGPSVSIGNLGADF